LADVESACCSAAMNDAVRPRKKGNARHQESVKLEDSCFFRLQRQLRVPFYSHENDAAPAGLKSPSATVLGAVALYTRREGRGKFRR
jgi:hypothetical protein